MFDNVKKKFISELDSRSYSYTYNAVDKVFDEWFKAKRPLIELLSKHPNWDPEHFLIRFDEDYSRQIDVNVTMNFLWWLNAQQKVNEEMPKLCKHDKVYGFVICSLWGFMTRCSKDTYLNVNGDQEEEELEFVNSLKDEFNFRAGMKTTKIIGKICKAFNWNVFEEDIFNPVTGEHKTVNAYEREYAKFCDALSPIKVTRHTVLSVNPIDFLLMSNGNSWRSCHYIGDDCHDAGCYSSGTVSYMLDTDSFLFYTIDAGFDEEWIEREPKIQRQIFGYHDSQIVQSRLYPQGNDYGAGDTYTDIRNVVQKVIADCLAEPNFWVKRSVRNVEHGNCATCYPDWSCQSNLCSTSVLKSKESVDLVGIILGAEPICLSCGQHHTNNENILCEDCDGSRYYCESCGEVIDEDEVYWVNGEPYCYDCVEYCDYCWEYHVREDMIWIPSEDKYVCERHVNEYYTLCDHCQNYVKTNNTTYIESEDKTVCSDCLEDYYVQCEDCGEWFKPKDMNQYFDNGVIFNLCDSCCEMRVEDEATEEEIC